MDEPAVVPQADAIYSALLSFPPSRDDAGPSSSNALPTKSQSFDMPRPSSAQTQFRIEKGKLVPAMPDIRIYSPSELPSSLSRTASPQPQRLRDVPRSAGDGRFSSMSMRSTDDIDLGRIDGAAEIPDIPLRRSSRHPRGQLDSGRPMSPLDQMVAENEEFIAAHSGPINPNTIHAGRDDRQAREEPRAVPARSAMASPEPLEVPPLSSPSPYPPSTITRSKNSSRSRANSSASTYQTNATSLPPLQTKGGDGSDGLEPLAEEEIEPGSFDLVVPSHGTGGIYSLEKRSELLFSKEHLQAIFDDAILLQRFTTFLCETRPRSVPLLIYYLDALKALKAISYSNAILEALESLKGHDFSTASPAATINAELQAKADRAFEALTRDELPAFITSVWIQTVSVSIAKRITGTLPIHLRNMSEGLAEVFCLTDPSRHDNPIVFASEEFHRTTQYGMNYVIGRNCRFLQGPKTNPFSVKRIREKLDAGKEHYETFLNYRRDGSPFMNLLMCAPLFDSRGVIRYFIGAQVDVSGLAKDCAGLEALRRLVDREEQADMNHNGISNHAAPEDGDAAGNAATMGPIEPSAHPEKDEFRELSEMFNLQELETVRRNGGTMHRLQHEEVQHSEATSNWHKPRVLIQDEGSTTTGGHPYADDDGQSYHRGGGGGGQRGYDGSDGASLHSFAATPTSGRLTGVYEHYLLVRPYPSLRILFASPSLRVPGMLQSPLLSRIGGSPRVRDELTQAFADGNGITARVKWVSSTKAGEAGGGRPRWIHCTPLQGSNGAIGVWMVVIIDDDVDGEGASGPNGAASAAAGGGGGRGRRAPPVDPRIGRFHRRHSRKPTLVGAGNGRAGDDNMSLADFASLHHQSNLRDEPEMRRLAMEMRGETRLGRHHGGGGSGGAVVSPVLDAFAMRGGGGEFGEQASLRGSRPASPYSLRIGDY